MLRDESNCDGGSIVEKLESFVQGKVSESFATGIGYFLWLCVSAAGPYYVVWQEVLLFNLLIIKSE